MHVPGYRVGDSVVMAIGPTGWPHSIIVDSEGKRFSDESFYHSIVQGVVRGRAAEGRPIFLVWDEDHHQKWGTAPAGPGEPYPDGMPVKTAETVRDLAVQLGITDPDALVATVNRFNEGARLGKDPEWRRGENKWTLRAAGQPSHKPNATLGPLERAPYFGIELIIMNSGIGNAGVRTGLHGRVMDGRGHAIQGLYAAGVVASPTMMGTGYNSGWSISRALVFGYLAAEDIAAAKQ